MKVCIVSESPADEAAVQILVAGVLGRTIELVPTRIQRVGWSGARNVLPVVLRRLHFGTEADALVVVVDADDSPVHSTTPPCDAACRLCELRALLGRERARLGARPVGAPVQTAVGLAVPAIEGWYLCGKDPHVSEAVWARKDVRRPQRRKLKQDVYGTERPSLPVMTARAVEEAKRLAADLEPLLRQVPGGFGALAADVRGWRAP